jgi:hypothetical protein
MDATGLIVSLVNFERAAARSGDLATRDFVVEMQNWVLQMQRENLNLRRDNLILRLRAETMGPQPAALGQTAKAAASFPQDTNALRNRERIAAETSRSGGPKPPALAQAM